MRIDFTKGKVDGVLIESRRAGEDGWTELGKDNYSPYVDGRAATTLGRPEVCEYRLRFLKRDEAVGEWSDIISTSTMP